ncbi:nucleotidyltransferase domain-containing protein [Candidatus Daviesbacteria bacterium]|nr:nucleotidyltransferase domain-containing protein [Candidatus Daviesbacteria bacterium]
MTSSNLDEKKLANIFKLLPAVKLVYFFGSKALGKEGPLSDYDFAVYLDEQDAKKRFQTRMELLGKLSISLGTDKIDLSVLNDIERPELKYSIITSGHVIYEREPFKILLEPKILNEYFDFMDGLKRFGLTRNI